MPPGSTKLSLGAASFLACSLGCLVSLVVYYGSVYLMFCAALPQSSCLQFLHKSEIWWVSLFVGGVGFLTGLLFLLIRATLQSEHEPIIGGLILLTLIYLPGMFWISNTILWPTFMESYPAVAYRQADVGDKKRIYLQILADTHVGDTLETLRATLPQKFGPSFQEDRGFLGRQFYAIEVKNGIVTSVQVDPLPKPGPSPTRITYIFPEQFTGWAHICFATPGAALLPMEGRHMTIEFPASGLVVTSTPPTFGAHQSHFIRLGPESSQNLSRKPKSREVGIVTQRFGTNVADATNRTVTLRMAGRTFVGTNAQMKSSPASQGGVDRCPPGIVRSY